MKFYCHPKCSTCKKAEKWLDENQIPYEWINLKEETPDQAILLRLLEQEGRSRKSFFNTSGKRYRELDLKNKVDQMSNQEAAELLSSDGMLLKRPFAIEGDLVTVGFKVDQYQNVWK